MSDISRREFVGASAMAAAGLTTGLQAALAGMPAESRRRAGVIASVNGVACCELAWKMINESADPLDAVIAGVNLVEDDPEDMSVGYGGLPNEDGVVELDASVMHGPTHKAGAVGALRNIRYPSKVARLVMSRTDHVLLVGEGALRFARAHGFQEENLLTDKSRRAWLKWKESLSQDDKWLEEHEADAAMRDIIRNRPPGTIHCSAVTPSGDLAGVTTTSGLAFKIPGRVGDSPIIGAGLYVDNEVGAAGSTGRGEANLQNLSSFMVVESMRRGMSPEEACLDVMRRVAGTTESRLREESGRPKYDLRLYAIRKDGEYGGAAMRGAGRMAYADADGGKVVKISGLFE